MPALGLWPLLSTRGDTREIVIYICIEKSFPPSFSTSLKPFPPRAASIYPATILDATNRAHEEIETRPCSLPSLASSSQILSKRSSPIRGPEFPADTFVDTLHRKQSATISEKPDRHVRARSSLPFRDHGILRLNPKQAPCLK